MQSDVGSVRSTAKILPADWGPTRDLVGRWSFEREPARRRSKSSPAVDCEHGSPRFVASPVGTGVELDGQAFLNAGDVGEIRIFRQFHAGRLGQAVPVPMPARSFRG